MHCDDVLHEREQIKINEIGINMGLNPFAMKTYFKHDAKITQWTN